MLLTELGIITSPSLPLYFVSTPFSITKSVGLLFFVFCFFSVVDAATFFALTEVFLVLAEVSFASTFFSGFFLGVATAVAAVFVSGFAFPYAAHHKSRHSFDIFGEKAKLFSRRLQ